MSVEEIQIEIERRVDQLRAEIQASGALGIDIHVVYCDGVSQYQYFGDLDIPQSVLEFAAMPVQGSAQ